MKKNLFLYLFIFAVLINIFTYMYFTNKAKYNDGRIKSMQERITTSSDSLKSITSRLDEADYFSLENNDNAIDYFGVADIKGLAAKVREGIDQMNQTKGGNPLVDYPAVGGAPFIINKVKILNHRWIIADFSNGSAWGEVLLKYFIDSDGKVSYETMQTVLYSDTVN